MSRITALAFAGIIAISITSIAPAQDTERELRRENEALRSQMTDLQAELDALKKENERLREEIKRLQAALSSGNTGSTPTQPANDLPVTIDESVPNASPRAHRKAVKASYDDMLGSDDIGYPDSQERRLYMRQVERWQTLATREFRLQIEWLVRVESDEDLARGGLRVVAVDPGSGATLGDPFMVAVPRGSMRRLEQLRSRRELTTLVLKGVLQPNLRIDPNLEEPGAFDRTLFLAPFVTYEMNIDVQSLNTPPPPKEDRAGG